MSLYHFYYIIELVDYINDYSELLGKFDSLPKAYDYILEYTNKYNYIIILDYKFLAEDQSKGSIVSVDNTKKPSKFLYITSDIRKRRKMTM
jgi:hypothetical protein